MSEESDGEGPEWNEMIKEMEAKESNVCVNCGRPDGTGPCVPCVFPGACNFENHIGPPYEARKPKCTTHKRYAIECLRDAEARALPRGHVLVSRVPPAQTTPLEARRRFQHDCTSCVHLETVFMHGRWLDLYHCPNSMNGELGGSLIARFGNDGPDYASYPLDVWRSVRDTHATVRPGGYLEDRTVAQREAAIEYAYGRLIGVEDSKHRGTRIQGADNDHRTARQMGVITSTQVNKLRRLAKEIAQAKRPPCLSGCLEHEVLSTSHMPDCINGGVLNALRELLKDMGDL